MEESHRARKIETERCVRDSLENGVRTESFVIELFRRPGSSDIFRIEPNFGSGDEGSRNRGTVSIRRSLILRLSNCELFAAIVVEFGKLLGEIVRILIPDGHIQSQCCTGIVAVVGEEWGNLSSRVGSVVIREFGEREEIGPVVLLVVAVQSEVTFERLVHPFGLAVSFGMICGGEVELHVE